MAMVVFSNPFLPVSYLYFSQFAVTADDQQYSCPGPCRDLRCVNAPYSQHKRKQQRAANPHSQLHETGNHRNESIPEALERGPVNKQEVQHRQASRHHAQELVSEGEHLFRERLLVPDKQAQDLAAMTDRKQAVGTAMMVFLLMKNPS